MLPGARSRSQVVSFKPYFAVDYDSPSGNDDYTHQYGMVAWPQAEAVKVCWANWTLKGGVLYIRSECDIRRNPRKGI